MKIWILTFFMSPGYTYLAPHQNCTNLFIVATIYDTILRTPIKVLIFLAVGNKVKIVFIGEPKSVPELLLEVFILEHENIVNIHLVPR